ncbi:hypothetical protein ACQKII_10700 [Lysinibacillus sp. NPDC048646]|uniref:hypothetical protein n=1 Tax=Lysinibacillus sp. NPDC048646 TaxID=3390574 RepID=UPI003CFBC74F
MAYYFFDIKVKIRLDSRSSYIAREKRSGFLPYRKRWVLFEGLVGQAINSLQIAYLSA